jgi:hypothetical protein
MANEFVARNGIIAQNDSIVTGSLTVTQGITGSLLGTASYAESSSYSETSSYALNVLPPGGSDTQVQFNNGGNFGGDSSFTFIVANSSLQQGANTQAIGAYSHAEGYNTITGTQKAYYANPISSGIITLSSGYGDVSSEFTPGGLLYLYDAPFDGVYQKAIFTISQSYSIFSNTIVELYDTSVTTSEAYVGDLTYRVRNWTGDQIIPGDQSHTEGRSTIAIGEFSHAEGVITQAIGENSHAEGEDTQAIGGASHTEGYNTQAIGYYSHAEGANTQAIGENSHAEGSITQTIGAASHAEGRYTQAIGQGSHAEGSYTQTGTTKAYYARRRGSIFQLSEIYGDVSSLFSSGLLFLDDTNYDNRYGIAIFEIISSTWDGNKTTVDIGFTPDTSEAIVGNLSISIGDWAGDQTIPGNYSHTEGDHTYTLGSYSHTEGMGTVALGINQHVQGQYNKFSTEPYSFIIGNGIDDSTRSTLIFASGSQFQISGSLYVSGALESGGTGHIITYDTTSGLFTYTASSAIGGGGSSTPGGSDTQIQFNSGSTFSGSSNFTFNYISQSLQQGNTNSAIGAWSHAEGQTTQAIGQASHAEGTSTIASGSWSHAEGITTQAIGQGSHAEGYLTIASGSWSHAEGFSNIATADYSHAEGIGTRAIGTGSHAEGSFVTASNRSSHAEGLFTQAIGTGSHAEGNQTIASGSFSHAEGNDNQAIGQGSHAEGNQTTSSGFYSHAEGQTTQAIGAASHAEGNNTQAIGNYSHAEGNQTIASGTYQHVQGQYNISSSAQSAFIIGNGTSNANRRNLIFASGSQFQISGSLFITGSTQGNGSGHVLTFNTSSGEVSFAAADVSNLKSGSFGITIDGNGGVISIGQKGYVTVPYNGTITDWEMFADQSGTCNIDIRKSTFATFPTLTSITGSTPISMSAAQKASSSILTGWTSSISAGDVYGFTLNSATSITRLNLIINTIKS